MALKQEGASIKDIAEKLKLTNYTKNIDLADCFIKVRDINRPALQLTGFYDHFDSNRIQLIGMVEYAYLNGQHDENERHEIYKKLFSNHIPAVIVCRGLEPEKNFLEEAEKAGTPVLGTSRATSQFEAALINVLSYELAPTTTIHGVLVDVYGEGLLITGESGIGKSEAALELVRRGHRLVADDVVEIRRVNDTTLIGTSPAITKYLIELRGIGIIDVKSLYGVECVKDTQTIDLVIQLEDWHRDTDYDRLGLDDEYIEILGQKVVCHSLPIRPGRNLAIICETAAVNHRQKKMGYNAAAELYKRVQENIVGASKEIK
ncbi:MAG: HPr(Ser) kinase/phosphatase [Lachnospiraceae bacterium]|uniref:HPr kinase/phosphorylase n=1 Tax=Candidatus Weimeria bifida TaxID=2599074 RepID=A0A6N7J1I2_9FIRM|nr:HPr(Ser) kinase/phosphatase [Candidatus Weimeria bifida]RRF96452.1 MAG: HPr(Ser) kinase/phosphatase [Lachnospiraceae bacterium]